MRSRLIFVSLSALSIMFLHAACGGDDGGGGGGGLPDASVKMDAAVQMDAPAAIMGLGQKCDQSTPCPQSAPTCVRVGTSTVGFCSLLCHADAQMKTDANGQISTQTDTSADNPKCAAIFTASPGTGVCGMPVNVSPTPTNPPQKNTTFTYQAHCVVQCGAGNSCPAGLTCNTQVMWCVP